MQLNQFAEVDYLPAPPDSVPGILDYPQFAPTDIPQSSGATRAWIGSIQPFLDDAAARRFVRCVDAGKPFDVLQGTIETDTLLENPHWADPWLVKTTMRFKLLILEFREPEHPRSYSLQPEISRQMHPLHPHLRTDRAVLANRRLIPAMCVYSGSEFKYSPNWPKIVQFLDQTATFVGRHIIWLKTRTQLPHRFGDRFLSPLPGEPIFDHGPLYLADRNFSTIRFQPSFWSGYWPGASAPCGIESHLKSIGTSQECWCWSGKKYGECHRPIELNWQRAQYSL